jgi:ABC-type multidrug transport system ATPase subunit
MTGVSPEQMHSNFMGEAIYSAEVDVHFPQLTVGQTLTFAANARAVSKPFDPLTLATNASCWSQAERVLDALGQRRHGPLRYLPHCQH